MKTRNLLFFVVCLIFGLNIKAQDNYQLVTDLSQIKNGSTIILAARHDSLSPANYYAMANAAAGKPQSTSFTTTLSDDRIVLPPEITDNESNFSWVVGMTDGNYTFVNPDGDMLGYGTSGTDFVKNGINSTWSIVASMSGTETSVPNYNAFVITNVGVDNRSVAFRKYNNGTLYEKFAPYANSETNLNGDVYFFYIDIFVKSSEVTPMVSLPRFSPEGGNYTSAQNVSITCETENVTIYYTLDGSNPSEESSVYSKPIEVTSSTTIKAVAKKDGLMNSGMVSATYNIIDEVAVTFYSNGNLLETRTMASGDVLGVLPEATVPEGFSFNGWTDCEIQGSVLQSPTMVVPTMKVEKDTDFYAVFSVSNSNCVETEISSLNKQDVVVIAISKDDKYYAMSQIKGSSGQPTACEVSVYDGKLTGVVTDDLKWNVSNNNGNMIIHPNGDDESWLYCTSGSNNNSVRIGTNADNNIFRLNTAEIDDETYPDYLYNVATERFVGAYYDEGVAIDWRAYKLTASGAFPTNIKNQTYHFFKYDGISYYCTSVDMPQSQTIALNTTWENVCITNKIIVENGAALTLNGAVACSNADNLIIRDGGQLIHNCSGLKATVEKEIKGFGSTNAGWYTISSPLVGNITVSDIESLMPATSICDLYRYDESKSTWENIKNDNNSFVALESGRGYLYANEHDVTISFAGELNGSSVSYNMTRTEGGELSGFNLIGNPYAHDIYIGDGGAIDDANLSKGYYTLSNSGAWLANLLENQPIEPCQGVLVKTMKEGKLNINKTNNIPHRGGENDDIIAVSVKNDKYEDVVYVSYGEGIALEKINHQNEEVPMIYVPVENKNYAVAMLDKNVKEIPVSFKPKTMGEFTIEVLEIGDFEYVYLEDNQTGNITNMLVDSYTFIATTTDNEDRFVLKLYDINSVDEQDYDDIYVFVDNDNLVVSNVSGKSVLEVYDMMGRIVVRKESLCDNRMMISKDLFKNAIYIVKVIDDKGTKNQKIVISR